MTRRARRTAAVLALAAGALAIAPALAQPDRQPDRAGEREVGPDRVRAFLEQRLEATRASEATIAALLARLDAGESPEAVARDAREATRDAIEPIRERGARPGAPDGQRAERPAGQPNEGAQPTMAELFELLGEVDAPMRERIRRMADEDPERARAMLRDAAPRLRDLAQLKRDDPEAFRIRLAMMQAGRDAFRAATQHARARRDGAAPDELARRRDEVAGAVRRRVELERSLKIREIERLAQRVEGLRAELAAGGERLDEIVERETVRVLEGAARPRGQRRGDDQRQR